MIFLIILALIPIYIWFFSYLKLQRHMYSVPGPIPIPIIGNTLSLKPGEGFIPSLTNLQNKYGEIVKLLVGYQPTIFISGTKPLEFLLSSNVLLDKSDDYNYQKQWLGDGLLLSTGDKWKSYRRLLTPAFHFNILERFVQIFDQHSEVLISKLGKADETVDIIPYMKLYALDVISEAVMSTELNVQNDCNLDYLESIETAMRISVTRLTSAFRCWNFIHRRTSLYEQELKAVECIQNLSDFVIKKRMAEYDHEEHKQKKPSFLDILLSFRVDGKPLALETIRDEVNTFMFAGHDTTSSALSFLLYSLSKHADVQEKCFREVYENLAGDFNKQFTYKDLVELKYLDQVIKESLRIYPPVVTTGRQIKEDTYYDGTLWPKGLQITLFLYGLHHQPSLYPNPEMFNPERFSPENSKNRSLYSYVPFSAGPRNCIGQRFAMLELKATIVHILREFEIKSVEDHHPVLMGIVLTSANGLLIRLKKRQYYLD